jgi:hypothetical protein
MKQKILSFVLTGTSLTLLGAGDLARPDMEKVYWDTVTETGEFAGGNLMMRTQSKESLLGRGITNVETLIENGPSSNRIDLVFVGDGYTVADLDDYEIHVNNAVNDFFGIEPLQAYLPLFNVHRVDVISNESGVDNDPVEGIEKDTAMDMGFWCSGIERLLCVDTSLAWGFANNVPSTDTILAVANSSMYGGAGYSWAEVGTFSGANSAATDVAIHEFGHSMANLADEYFYSGDTYTGPEPTERNASIYDASAMEELGTKWANWLGASGDPWDGICDTFEGCMYADYGIYRPSDNSMMRALNRPFNQPSAESFILEMYNIVDPIDDHTPAGVLDGSETVFVTPVEINHPMQIEWFLDGEQLDIDGATSLEISTLGLSAGLYNLQVHVVDPTEWVRDEVARDAIMKQTVIWPVQIDEVICVGDINGDGNVNVDDLLEVISSWGPCSGCSADINGDGTVNVTDLLSLVDAWGVCP